MVKINNSTKAAISSTMAVMAGIITGVMLIAQISSIESWSLFICFAFLSIAFQITIKDEETEE